MKNIQLLVFSLLFASCSVTKNQHWKLERTPDREEVAKTVVLQQEDYRTDQMSAEIAKLEVSLPIPKHVSDEPSLANAVGLEKNPIKPKIYKPTDYYDSSQSALPKKEKSELQKLQRSFRRQATWFFIFSIISLMITSGMFDIGEFAVAFPFLLLTLAGLTAFIMALRYMVKAKRLKKKKDALDENDTQTLEQLRRMKKLGFWGVMCGLGVGILSIVLLIIWI
jgi:Flp pilus assembly protein TadB